MNIIEFQKNLVTHPFTHFTIGLFFAASGLSDITVSFSENLEHLSVGTQHGVFLLGLMIMIRSFAELIEDFESAEENLLTSAIPSIAFLARGLSAFCHSKIVLALVGPLLCISGFTDAWALVKTSEFAGSSSALMLIVCGLGSLSFVLLGTFEGEKHMTRGSAVNHWFAGYFSPKLMLAVAMVILILSVAEGAFVSEEFFRFHTDRAGFLWSIGVSLHNIVRSLNVIHNRDA